jgi:sodium transport system ATP-binding protein
MIRVENLSKRFRTNSKRKTVSHKNSPGKKIDAVADVSFECKPGRVFSLLGANGAGKTTTLRLIATMLKPTSGSITVNGHDALKRPRAVRKSIGFLTGATGLYTRLTPTEMVKYMADLHGMDRKAYERRRDEVFTLLDIHDVAGERIAKLSTGMRQKVSIARTIIHDPPVVVFDEPTAGLDVVTARSIIQLIRDFREQGKTVIFSTHIMGEVSLLCDDLAIIHEGKLLYSGTFRKFSGQMQSKSIEDEFIRIVEAA